MTIEYTLAASEPRTHRFNVTLRIAEPTTSGQILSLPAWIPGSYLVRDYARFVGRVSGRDERGAVRVTKTSKNRWQCAPASGALTLEYEIFAWDQSVRGAHLDDTHGFCNGVNVFLAVAGQEDQPVRVHLRHPDNIESTWRVATTLPRDGAQPWQFGAYRAADYDELIDHPIEMGEFTVVDTDVADVPHRVVLCGRHYCDEDRLARDVKRICEEHVALFGELPAMDEYLFLTRVLGQGYGGLEHRSSTALVCSRDQLPSDDADTNARYQSFLGLVSHEYFHTWNVKRIKPAVFTPYALDAESYTELLWVFEGITSYYDDLALVRSGAIRIDDYWRLLGAMTTRVLSAPGHQEQTLAESSFDTWIKFYKPTPDTANAVVSYYAKGALIALALDLTLRDRTNGKVSLDDVMRALWSRYGATGNGVPEDGFEALCEHVSGLELTAFFDQAIRSTEMVPLAPLLQTCGVDVSSSQGDGPSVSLGVVFEPDSARLRSVRRGSAAEKAGLAPGDELIALNGLKVVPASLSSALAAYKPGQTFDAHLFRDDELMVRPVTLDAAPETTWRFAANDDATAAQRARRAEWLHRDA
ncbi:MAG: PDZ domain-containing protein [Pseudomonadota bacterium]